MTEPSPSQFSHRPLATLNEKRPASYLRLRGGHLQAGYNQLARERGLGFTRAIGMESRTLIQFDAEAGDPLLQKSLMQQEMLRHGVLWGGFHNLSFAHGDEEIAVRPRRNLKPITRFHVTGAGANPPKSSSIS